MTPVNFFDRSLIGYTFSKCQRPLKTLRRRFGVEKTWKRPGDEQTAGSTNHRSN
jgi:hypothetical protein